MNTKAHVNKRYCTDHLSVDYAHVGLMDVVNRTIWIARKSWRIKPIQISHARMLEGGTNTTSVAAKDRFICYWFHTPNTGEGLVHGYPIEWDEAHLMVRVDPSWNYLSQELIPRTDTARIEKNIDQQYAWGRAIFEAYTSMKPKFPLSWHLVGPRPADSMFYVERVEGHA